MAKPSVLAQLRILFDDDDCPEVLINLDRESDEGVVTYSSGEEYELALPSGKKIVLDFEATIDGRKPPEIIASIVEGEEVTVALRCLGACIARVQTRHGEFITLEYGEGPWS